MMKKCCVCRKVKMEGKWQSDILILADTRISHAYCPSCFTKTMARIKRSFPAAANNLSHGGREHVAYGI